MKKVIALVLSLVMVLGLLAGCGNKQNDSDKKNDGKDYSNVKIGVMLSGSANDGGWSQMAADAAKAASKDYPGSTVNYSESISATDFESTMRGYADAGYTIIVSHGAEFLDAAKLVSKEYPNITFICTSAQSGQEPNLTGIDFATYQLGFLNGAAWRHGLPRPRRSVLLAPMRSTPSLHGAMALSPVPSTSIPSAKYSPCTPVPLTML